VARRGERAAKLQVGRLAAAIDDQKSGRATGSCQRLVAIGGLADVVAKDVEKF
jgi:hypothetical protein